MDIQQEELQYKQDPTISLFGTKLDSLTVSMFSFGIALSIFIWFYFGFFTGHNRYFLIVLCLFFIYQIFASGRYAGSYSMEDNEMKEVVQANSVLFSSLIIILAFGNKSFNDDNNKMLVISLLLSLVAIIYYSMKKTSDYKRMIRKLKITFMTISIFIFAMMIFNVGVSQFNLLK